MQKVTYSKQKSDAVAKMDGTFGKKETAKAAMPEVKVDKKKPAEGMCFAGCLLFRQPMFG